MAREFLGLPIMASRRVPPGYILLVNKGGDGAVITPTGDITPIMRGSVLAAVLRATITEEASDAK